MSCSCNDKHEDLFHKPKVSDYQLDMLRKMIKRLCKCNNESIPEDGGGNNGCNPTLIKNLSGPPFNSHIITYRKNGGEIKTIDTFDFTSIEDSMAFSSELFGTTYNGIPLATFYMDINMEEEVYIGGGTKEGLFRSPRVPDPIILTEPYFFFNTMYEPPFVTHPVETTLEIFRNTDVPPEEDMYFDFEGSETGEPIIFKSCSGLELANGVPAPMPNPPPPPPGGMV